MHLLVVGGTWNTVSVVLSRFLPNLLVIILALFMGPRELGVYSYILATYTVLSLFADLGIAFSLQKFIPENPAETARMATTALVVRLLSSAALGALCLLTDHLWKALKGQGFYISLLLVSSAFGTTVFVLNARLKYRKASLLTMARTVFWFGLAVVLVAAGWHITGPIWSLSLAFVVFGLLTIFLEKSLFAWSLDWHFARQAISFGVPMTTASAFSILASQAGVLAIAYLMTEGEVGIYKLATIVGMTPMLLGDGLVIPLLPLVKKKMIERSAETAELVRLLVRFLAGIGLFAFGAGVILAKPLISLVFGPTYLASVDPSRILLGASVPGLLFTVLLSILYMSDDLRTAVKITGAVAVLSVGGSLALIPLYGARGAALSLLLAFGTGLLVVGLRLGRRLSVPFEWRRYGIYILSTAETAVLLALFVSAIPSLIWGLVGGVVLAPGLYLAALAIQGGLTRTEITRFVQIIKARSA
ncbi:MAG: oligosaccharide flippase family protein [Candidatus Aminicenantes bacterium]|nr:oligosaccharide flippase family protein [Candidatus Aminicenantes bacterium]